MSSGLKRYAFSELNKDRLGEGTYGTVFRGKDMTTGEDVAVKKAKIEVSVEEGLPCTVMREIALLQWLNEEDDHSIGLKSHYFSEGPKPTMLMVFERAECDLKKFVEKTCRRHGGRRVPMEPSLAKHILRDLLKGLHTLHSCGFAHRDLKPQNILVSTKDGLPAAKLADFGLARNLTVPVAEYTHEIMTLWYRAPEVLLGGAYNYQIDIWSMGCIFAELFLGRPVFHADCEYCQLIKIFEFLGLPSEQIWPGVTKLPFWHEYPKFKPGKIQDMLEIMGGDLAGLDLLSKMLCYDPAQRINAQDALVHPYFST